MKKTFLILFLSLGFFSNDTQAQTMNETIDWIKTKPLYFDNGNASAYFSLKPVYPNDVELLTPTLSFYADGVFLAGVYRIKLSKVSAVQYNAYEKIKGYSLVLSGPADEGIKNGKTYMPFSEGLNGVQFVEKAVTNFELRYGNVSEDEIKRIKKAYEHLAKLCGAKLVSDDLFKN
ncbi:hypothetical protein [Runella limosa]|uniref:hypothetical protein n=1 Tax=Runella limosa TaxID=370978 RepID=UPI000401C457|nr:hypothetical protein [Runella limosa]